MNANLVELVLVPPDAEAVRTRETRDTRTNQQWLDELSGRCSPAVQRQAHEELARYLHRVALTYLNKRRTSVPLLNALSYEELAQFAQDFVQDVLVKMTRDDFALLNKFGDRGRFVAWMAQVLHNSIAGELRLSAWQTRTSASSDDILITFTDNSPCPEQMTLQCEVGEELQWALGELPDHYRIAFLERVVEGRPADEVGEVLGLSANAVYILVYRAKEKLRRLLAQVGITEETLGCFA